ncbi:MAG: dTDP-4-dehydrorhamnose reductase [Actinobacteria bacterium]|nr:dTDP-4-dehydrorhamnose reductase [Actinomycetota bacterium]
MRVIICGAAGQLGSDLVEVFRSRGHEVFGFDLDLDITDHGLVMEKIPPLRPDLLINTVADIDADRAELDPEPSLRVNFTGNQNLALASLECGCAMAFISSDYVFDGRKGAAYNEFDAPNPQSVYGRAKLASERYLASLLPRHFIFRTQWLFGRAGRRNFVKSILRNAREKGALRVVTDEVGTPTYTGDLAGIIHDVCVSGKYGLYHATNRGVCSRYDFAREIVDIAGWKDIPVEPILYADLNLPCPRPPYSPLDNMNLRLQGFPAARHYSEPLEEYVAWLLENDGF